MVLSGSEHGDEMFSRMQLGMQVQANILLKWRMALTAEFTTLSAARKCFKQTHARSSQTRTRFCIITLHNYDLISSQECSSQVF
jgi:hypothetical protein